MVKPQPSDPALTDTQLAEYRENGYVLAKQVFAQDELDRINAELDRLNASRAKDGGSPNVLLSLGRQSELTEQICEDARLLDLISPLVHPGIAIYSAKLISKEPYDETACHWHQDEAYYIKNSASDCRLSVYVALQDITPEMGCLQVIPGSHRSGLKQAAVKADGLCRLAMVEPPKLDNAVAVPMSAGDVLIFDALLHHGSDGNPTPYRRRAFIVSYQEATASQGNGQQWKILRQT